MNNDAPFQRLAAITSLLATLLALGSIGLLAMVLGINTDPLSNPTFLLETGANGASLFRWGMILDMFGYYLLLAPLAFLLWSRFKPKDMNLTNLSTFCGLAYILIGAIGAATLASISLPLIESYGHASNQQRQIFEVVFSGFLNIVYVGLWNLLESSLSAIWWLGIGLFLRREQPALGLFTTALGIFALLDALGRILNVQIIYTVGLAGVLLLIPIWTLWFGIDLLRSRQIPTSIA
ncbi:MAG TPA: hypothetical protein VFQ30_15565 [Ktedonobacteraceae bacterium]|nr:hypothetical protein [Ktedonobacteraceae bacterium]